MLSTAAKPAASPGGSATLFQPFSGGRAAEEPGSDWAQQQQRSKLLWSGAGRGGAGRGGGEGQRQHWAEGMAGWWASASAPGALPAPGILERCCPRTPLPL